jgi:UDP-N-acetylglucosamine--N-acetylmuramyl-(pentapeptide) pyrophosphoryl-undecaprenol N-acetylglucosamine transferase
MPQIELGLDLHDGAPTLLFVSSTGALDAGMLADARIPTATVASSPLSRTSVFSAALGLAGNAVGVAQALPLVARFRPDVIIASGGYASVPVVSAAAMLRTARRLPGLKIALIEPNAMPGVANRALSRAADEVWGAYADTAAYFPGIFVKTGVPVRPEFYAPVAKADARKRLGLDPGRSTVLVFGGSQGARKINVAVSAMVARRRLPPEWQVLHVTGKRDYEWMAAERKAEHNENRYIAAAYLDDMALAHAASDVVVARAGASSLAEFAVSGLPALLVPYPHASEDHQRKNAQVFEARGAAIIIEDALLDADTLYWALLDIMNGDKRAAMGAAARGLSQPRALHQMVERILLGGIGKR